jgi:hypothetical protein
MDSTKKYPLQKQHIQTMVRDELEGFRGLVKQLLGQKIGFYEAQQESTKQNTPGVALASATTTNVQFMISFQEQLDEVKLEITTAPSNETVRRLKALVASAKSTFPKLQTSDIKKVLDLLLECVPYTMIKPNRTKGKDQKPEVEATGPSDLAQGKGGEVRRLIQDYIIKTVYTLASQFLPGADYPKNLEEYRDYFDLSKKGEELAETINKQKSKIAADREQIIKDDANKIAAKARLDAAVAAKVAEDAAKAKESMDKHMKNLQVKLNQDAAEIFHQLGGGQKAIDAMAVFAAAHYEMPLDQALHELGDKKVDYDLFNKILFAMKEYAQQNKTPISSFKKLADSAIPDLFDQIRAGQEIDVRPTRRLFALSKSGLMDHLTAGEREIVDRFENQTNDAMKDWLKANYAVDWNNVYQKPIGNMSKADLVKAFIIEGGFNIFAPAAPAAPVGAAAHANEDDKA